MPLTHIIRTATLLLLVALWSPWIHASGNGTIITLNYHDIIPEEELPKRIPVVAGKQQSKLLQE